MNPTATTTSPTFTKDELDALEEIYRSEPMLTLTEAEIDELGRLDAAKRATPGELPHEI